MNNKALRYAAFSQISLLSGVFICLVIRSKEAALNYPISYFGNFQDTIIPYAAGFLLCAFWLVRASQALPRDLRATRVLLLMIATCALGVLCTPYMVSSTVGLLHLSFAAALLLTELVFSMILIRKTYHVFAVLGFTVQLLGAVFAVISQLGMLHVELLSELAVLIGFSMLLSFYLQEHGGRLVAGA